jgi:hypothetical protein
MQAGFDWYGNRVGFEQASTINPARNSHAINIVTGKREKDSPGGAMVQPEHGSAIESRQFHE